MAQVAKAPDVPAPLKRLYTVGTKYQQERTTPEKLIEAFAELLGGRIGLDPCATRSARGHFADVNWNRGGLKKRWELPSYANPPWSDLGAWLLHARLEAARTGLPSIVLGPWRSHRNLFLSTLDGCDVVFLKALAFGGFRNTHPTPCFVASWNVALPRLPYELGRGRVAFTAPAT
jgi:hypothetical protein